MAWAAVYPNKIRITFLLSGNPVETIISTGEKISFLSHSGKHSFYTSDAKDPDMKDYLDVPVKMSELISIFLGHIPLKEFNDAYFSPSDSSFTTIITHQERKDGIQRLNYSSNEKIIRIESLDNFGNPLYDIHVLEYKTHEADNIPVKLQIAGGKVLHVQIQEVPRREREVPMMGEIVDGEQNFGFLNFAV